MTLCESFPMAWKCLSRFTAYRRLFTNASCQCKTNSINGTILFHRTLFTGPVVPNKADQSDVRKLDISKIPDIKDFVSSEVEVKHVPLEADDPPPYLQEAVFSEHPFGKTVYFEAYGCQMNVNDAEYAWAVLQNAGYKKTDVSEEADVVLLVTCSIREKAEQKIWARLRQLKKLKKRKRFYGYPKIGVLGCMAERLKKELVEKEKAVDVVAGPDAYRDLPRLLEHATSEPTTAINVMLSVDETYADIMPVRFDEKSKSAFVSIMRGCDNMCSYCIVPFTRGRERSRPVSSIVDEIKKLSDQGIKQVTLLGQNVNSYRDLSEEQHSTGTSDQATNLSEGFKTIYKPKMGGLRFADLLERVSGVDPEMRVRFTSPHPKDFPDEVLELIADRKNICKHIHLPAQSGSTRILEAMRRGHTRDDYLRLVQRARSIIPALSLSTDVITGFCSETESEHRETLELMETVKYNLAFLFKYSMRKKTHAYHKMTDTVSEQDKIRRLAEITEVYQRNLVEANRKYFDQVQLVLVERELDKTPGVLMGRSDGFIKVYISDDRIPAFGGSSDLVTPKPGDYVAAQLTSYKPNSFKARSLYVSSLNDFCSTVQPS